MKIMLRRRLSLRKPHESRCGNDGTLGVRRRHHGVRPAVAGPHVRDPRADSLDETGSLISSREWIEPAALVDVDEVDADSFEP
jgi:hypothetical protein